MAAAVPKPRKSNTKKKKKRVSKHVLKAEEKNNKSENKQSVTANDSEQSKKAIVKDPSEAAEYLQTWKDEKDKWKFNKNTQSWLIRHMYEDDKLTKTTFQTLLEYLNGLPEVGKTRVVAAATHRALRYREYEKQQEAGDSKDSTMSTTGAVKKEAGANDKKAEKEQKEEEDRWKKLDDHDKRKEYKRARKILETLKE
jgi:hypothetical protein